MYSYLTIYTRVSRRYSIFFYPPRRYFNPFYPASSSRRKLLAFFYTSVRGIKEVYLFFFYNYKKYPRKGLIVITIKEEEGDPSKISIIVLSYTITSIDSKSYLGVIEGYNIPFSRVIRCTDIEIKELNTTEKEKVLKANTIRDLSLFTFLAREKTYRKLLFFIPYKNEVNSLE
ncbi:uncharacterized protein LY79DRAFT_585442 [Colletotrichum navitas]|uniref:Uncharacterized protein n=1 Tax=Colletotrichum navitas TaxID=681940 RepID=A0AAD8PIJ0_9PEZI|nr:uncharacterized protein LY79DRAFT_585442 [Colletotrichum navitas]KAK1561659.1 hypothetical protein LY79DRAFT_585442 [Colletotrichum navitas]